MVSEHVSLPLTLSNNENYRAYTLTYDVNGEFTSSFDFDFIVQDQSGSVVFEDRISFTKDRSLYIRCAL